MLIDIGSRSLCNVSNSMTIAIVSKELWPRVIDVERCLQKYSTLVNICIIGLSYSLNPLILDQLRRFCEVKLTIPWLTLVYTLSSLPYMSFESPKSMMLKAIWLLTPFVIMCCSILIAIRFFLIFSYQKKGVLTFWA